MRRLMMMVLVMAAVPLCACTYRSIYEESESCRSEDCDTLDESPRVSCEARAETS